MILQPGKVQNNSTEYDALLFCKTNIAGYIFDAFLRVDHKRELEITSHPVETGAAITDHSYLQPTSLTFEVGMSDVHQSLVAGQFEGRYSRSVKAWDILMELQAQRIPLTALTRLGRFNNLLIKSITETDDYQELNGLRALVTMQEIIVGRVKTVKISAQPQVTNSTQRGTVQATTVIDESILYQLSGR